MSQLVDVATWVGLITGVIGISLSLIAIWFAFGVDSRSRKVTEQMIQSLQKIESSVERSSVDTQGLIKVAWERMLGGVGLPPERDSSEISETAIEQVSTGLAEEVRAEMRATPDTPSIDEDRIVQRVSEAIQAQLRSARPERSRPYERVEDWMRTLSSLSPDAYELARILESNGHLNRSQYNALRRETNFRPALFELRRAGIIVPLRGKGESEENQPVYWYPPNTRNELRIAFELLSKNYPEARERLRTALRDINYLDKDSAERGRSARRRDMRNPNSSSTISSVAPGNSGLEDSAITEEPESRD